MKNEPILWILIAAFAVLIIIIIIMVFHGLILPSAQISNSTMVSGITTPKI